MVKGQVDTVPRVVRRILQQSNYNKNDLPYANQVNGTLACVNAVEVKYVLEFDAIGTIDDYNQEVRAECLTCDR